LNDLLKIKGDEMFGNYDKWRTPSSWESSGFLYTPVSFSPLNTELIPICHLLALLGAHHILHVSRVRVKG
jgi:hypothetical protein